MTYTAESRVDTRGQCSASTIQQWVDGNAAAGAAYVGLPRTATPVDVGPAIVQYSSAWNINADMLAALCAHESAYFQSKICRDKNNPGGYGAENDDPYNKAIAFATMADGIRAVAAHLAGYVHGDGPWNTYSSRYAIVKSNGWAGSVTKLSDLNGKWAYPGTTYGQSLARVANDLLRFAATAPDEPATGKAQKPPMIHYPSPNKDGYGTPRKIEAVCNHIGTSTAASNLSWLTNPSSGASCNAYIKKDGTIYEIVPLASSPWTNGVVRNPDLNNPLIAGWVRNGINPNTRCYTIEHEGEPSDSLTPAQIKSNNALTAWVASEAGIDINATTIIGHYQIDSVDRPYCPSFSDAEWDQLISGARTLLDPNEPPLVQPPERLFSETGKKIVWGFKGHWERLEADGLAYQVLGWPVTNEFRTKVDDIERTVQLFERGGLAWYPESAGTPWEFRHLTHGELWGAAKDARRQGVLT